MTFKAMQKKTSPSLLSVLGLFLALIAFIAATFVPAAAISAPKVVVLGDSLSAGYQLPPEKGFVPRLQKALDDKNLIVQLIGAGVSGDTTSGGLARLDWSVPQDTDAVILELGANDALRGLPVATAEKNLDAILRRLQERGIKTLVAGMMAPPNMGEAYGKKFNALYPNLAKKYDAILYPFFLDGVAANPELNLEDGIHPNEKGIDVIVTKILPSVEKLIASLETPES